MNNEDHIGKLIAFEIAENEFAMALSLEVVTVIRMPPEDRLIPIPGSKGWLIGCISYSGKVVPIIDWGLYKKRPISSAKEILIVDDRKNGYIGLAVKNIEELVSIGEMSEMKSVENSEVLGTSVYQNKEWTIIDLNETLIKIANNPESLKK